MVIDGFKLWMSLTTTIALRATTRRRLFHSTTCVRRLVGPPDPISHIRPAVYHQEDPSSSTSYGDKVQHPYSLKEFTQVEGAQDYQVNLQKTQLDAFDHAFWTNVITSRESQFDQASHFHWCRTTTGSKLPKRRCWTRYQRTRQLKTKSSFSRTFTVIG